MANQRYIDEYVLARMCEPIPTPADADGWQAEEDRLGAVLGPLLPDYRLINRRLVAERKAFTRLPGWPPLAGYQPAVVEAAMWQAYSSLVWPCQSARWSHSTPLLALPGYIAYLVAHALAGREVPPDVAHYVRLYLDDDYDSDLRRSAEAGVREYYRAIVTGVAPA